LTNELVIHLVSYPVISRVGLVSAKPYCIFMCGKGLDSRIDRLPQKREDGRISNGQKPEFEAPISKEIGEYL